MKLIAPSRSESPVVRTSAMAIAVVFLGCSFAAADEKAFAPVSSPKELTTSFEEFSPGELRNSKDASGVWSAPSDHASVHVAHHRTGHQSLHLLGGENRQVEWTPQRIDADVDHLEFWLERWTKAAPFDFRVEASDGEKWTTLYQSQGNEKVGAFKNHISIPLTGGLPLRFRFTSTTPANSGVMIDDLSVRAATPQQVLSITASQPIIPVLVGSPLNPVLDIGVTVEGSLEPLTLNELELEIAGTISPAEIQRIDVFATGSLGSPNWKGLRVDSAELQRMGSSSDLTQKLSIAGNIELVPGANHFFVSVELLATVDPAKTVDVRCTAAMIAERRYDVKSNSASTDLRIGYALRKAGDDKVHTFRIPGLATTNNGTLIAVYDIRNQSGGDLPGDIDVGMSRSTDGGQSWEPMQTIFDMGNDPQWRYDGVGDPAVLVDQTTGVIWVAAVWSHGDRAWHHSGPGLTPEETGQLMLVRSDDDGKTWSAPINITSQVKRPEWSLLLQGPGKGITMRDGTIVFAAQYQDSPDLHRLPHSTIIYSRDHGQTWHAGAGAHDDTTEAQVVEIEPGVLMLNCRFNRESARVVMTSSDMGATWRPHVTSRKSLIEPGACMASLINVDQELGLKTNGWLLFSNPDSLTGRQRLMIKGSRDGGKTWPQEHRLLLDEGNGFGYSCMSMIDPQTIGILYEGSTSQLIFQRIPLTDVIGIQAPAAADTRPIRATRLSLPQIFGDHMVLQADAELPIWGSAPAGARVEVTLDKDRQATIADQAGQWMVRFRKRPVSTHPIVLQVQCNNEQVAVQDILLGEVWLCAGQSNMEWTLQATEHGAAEIKGANRPLIRLLDFKELAPGVPRVNSREQLASLTPQNYCAGKWAVASPETTANFSAVGWYFGRALQEKLHAPIGLINVGQGGSPTEAWMRRGRMESEPALRGLVQGNWLDNQLLGDFCRARGVQNLLPGIQAGENVPSDDLGPNHPFKPGFLWDAAVAPLIPLAIRGVIWYQGESNAETPQRVIQHTALLPLMIKDWRTQWGQGDFPFLYVQLPAIQRAAWPEFRDGQRRMLEMVDNVGMAITIDTGHPTDVHPRTKQTVGDRLALWALGTTYQKPQAADYAGPLYRRSEVQADAMIIDFDQVKSGLKSSDGEPLRHFELAAADGVYHPAAAKIDGATVVLTSPLVKSPQSARYAWSPFPQPAINFLNGAGLPASPFRTDNGDR